MDVTLPDLGENIEAAEVLNVLVRKGEAVSKDQPVLELETDKATFELPSPQAGTVSAILVKKGDTVRVGQKILTLEPGRAPEKSGRTQTDAPEDKADGKARTAPPARARERAEPAAERRAPADRRADDAEPRAGEDERHAGAAERRAGSAERQPDKDERRAGAPERRVDQAERRAGDAEQRADDAERRPPRPAEREERRARPADTADASQDEPEDGDQAGAQPDEPVAAGPSARRLAREHGVDLVRLRGTGSGGRITPEDVQAFVRDRASAAPRAPGAAAPATDVERWGPVERRPLTGIDKAAGRLLSASWTEIPHVTHHDLADVTELEEARRRYVAAQKDSEPKLTWTALVVKAAVAGLRAYPRLNSSLDLEREELVLKRYVHVGIAVDTEHGLLVPVVRDADRKTTRELAAEIASLAERARARKLGREDMQGASFTVTNLGGIGGTAFTPIVSRPEVAVLGIARGRDEVALREGQAVRRIMLPLCLSYDHRVVNGADAARFVRFVAELLEHPLRLVMES